MGKVPVKDGPMTATEIVRWREEMAREQQVRILAPLIERMKRVLGRKFGVGV